jgi:hypothetical protein
MDLLSMERSGWRLWRHVNLVTHFDQRKYFASDGLKEFRRKLRPARRSMCHLYTYTWHMEQHSREGYITQKIYAEMLTIY